MNVRDWTKVHECTECGEETVNEVQVCDECWEQL